MFLPERLHPENIQKQFLLDRVYDACIEIYWKYAVL